MDRSTFMSKFGAVFEHSPWVADAVYATGIDPLSGDADADADALGECFASVFMNARVEAQLATLMAHPQLVCDLAKPVELTTDSVAEQSGAGLDQCSAEEADEFGRLNTAYREKFGFPFIIAVRGLHRRAILEIFRQRLENSLEIEFQTALAQVCRIARFRIRAEFEI